MTAVRHVFAALILAVTGYALCPYPDPTPNALYFHSDAVFTGMVMAETEAQRSRNFDSGVFYSVMVTTWIKGHGPQRVRVFTERNSGGEYLKAGKHYLLFARHGDRTHPLVIACRRSIQEPSATVSAELAALKTAKPSGSISGEVSGLETPGGGIAGATVVIRGEAHEYNIKTDANGRFRADVPSGRYRIHVQYQEQAFEPYLLSLDSAQLKLRAGQNAYVTFVRKF
jgi:hypothetical protein